MVVNREWLKDTAERVASTFVEAGLGVVVLSGVIDTDTLQKAELAGAVAAASFLKGAIAKKFGSSDSASLVA
jgi:hypothetical protein